MANVSIRPELDEAEAVLTRLAQAIERKTPNQEFKKEYYTLLQQACGALNQMRSLAETDDFFTSGMADRLLKKLKR